MTRRLRVIPADASGAEVAVALREALSGGDAILPAAPGNRPTGLPDTVPQRVALVVETSGSTGTPKRVALSSDALLANAAASESALGGPAQWLLALPTHYIAGLNVLSRSFAAGTEPIAVAGTHFTAAAFVAAAERMTVPERCTALVPAQLATLLDDPAATDVLRRFQAVLVGGQATPTTLLLRAQESGIRVRRSYGSSETSGGCIYDGHPIGTATVRVVDDEVWVGGPSLAEGYLGDPRLTDERFVSDDSGRWFRTADAGAWDGETLSISGRRDDVLVSGGVKVSVGAVERALRELPGLSDSAVVAADDARWGQVPVAFTTGRVDADAVGAALAAELGVAARPARIIRLPSLPTLASGKVDRRALAALAAEAHRGAP